MKRLDSSCALGLGAGLFSILLLLGTAPASAQHWGYEGENGPERWSKLDPAFAMCSLGRNQSPIDIGDTLDAPLKPLGIAYRPGASKITNNGHTVQVDFAPGSTLSVDGRSFELKQFHFHAPSENRVGGRSFPLEAHLVHADKEGNLAVVAVMFSEGTEHPALARLWRALPDGAGKSSTPDPGISAVSLLPADRDYYRYNGSLTTPPCSEGVRWLVMKKPVSASGAQIAAFVRAVGVPNNRPIQPVNARPVLR